MIKPNYTFELHSQSQSVHGCYFDKKAFRVLDELLRLTDSGIMNQNEIVIHVFYGSDEFGSFEVFYTDKWLVKTFATDFVYVDYRPNWDCVNWHFGHTRDPFDVNIEVQNALAFEQMHKTYIAPYVEAFKKCSNNNLEIKLSYCFNVHHELMESDDFQITVSNDNETRTFKCSRDELLERVANITEWG